MKKLALIVAAAGLGLVLCASEILAKGGGGSRGGSHAARSRGSSAHARSKAGHGGLHAGGSKGRSHAGNHPGRGGKGRSQGGMHSPSPSSRVARHSPSKHRPPTRTSRRSRHGGGGGDGFGGDSFGWDDGGFEGSILPAGLPGAVVPVATGMAIRQLLPGTAHRQGMKVGDIIMEVNGAATTDYESLRSALRKSGSQAEVDFINVDNGVRERITLNPNGGAIGAYVEQVDVDTE